MLTTCFPLWLTCTVTSEAALTLAELIPLIVMVPVRSSPVFAVTETATEPFPSPEPLSTLIQSAEGATPQVELDETFSITNLESSGSKDRDVGETVSVCWTISGSFSLHENACDATKSRQANGNMALLITTNINGKPESGQGLRPVKSLESCHDSFQGLRILGHLAATGGTADADGLTTATDVRL